VVNGYINLKLNLGSILLTDVCPISQIVTFLYVCIVGTLTFVFLTFVKSFIPKKSVHCEK
jgi:hypothetical protein